MNVLSPDRMKQLAALQGTRGVIGSLVSVAALLDGTNGYYVDVLARNPELRESMNRDGDKLQYGDDDGVFSLQKLANAVKSTIDRKRASALVDGHTFPNVESIRDDDADTVYIVNWDVAPSGDDDNTGASEDDA